MSTPQPDPQFVIAALTEELRAAHDNRLYLLSLLKHVQAEQSSAAVQWEAEKESLLATIRTHEAPRAD